MALNRRQGEQTLRLRSVTPWFKVWGRRAGYAVLVVVLVLPWAAIAWGRAQRSDSAPAILEQIWRQPNGRVTVGAFSFTVDGEVYRGQDGDQPTPRRAVEPGARTSSTECRCVTTRHSQARISPWLRLDIGAAMPTSSRLTGGGNG